MNNPGPCPSLNLQQIPYREPPTPMMLPVFLGNRQRYPSVTDVIILGPNLYLVAHRYASKLYITEVDPITHTHRNLFTETTIYQGHTHYVESMEIHENNSLGTEGAESCSAPWERGVVKVYVISYSEYLLVYRYEYPRLIYEKTIFIGPPSVRYHGIKVYLGQIYLTPSVGESTTYPTEIVRLDPVSEQIERIRSPELQSNYRIKDMIFFNENTILLVINYKISKRMTQRGAVFHGFLGLYTYTYASQSLEDLQLVDRVEFEHTHFDRGVYDPHQDIFYVTGGNKDGGYLWRGRVEKDPASTPRLAMMAPIPVADFPHGIRVEREINTETKTETETKTKIAFTSYGTDSMYYGYVE